LLPPGTVTLPPGTGAGYAPAFVTHGGLTTGPFPSSPSPSLPTPLPAQGRPAPSAAVPANAVPPLPAGAFVGVRVDGGFAFPDAAEAVYVAFFPGMTIRQALQSSGLAAFDAEGRLNAVSGIRTSNVVGHRIRCNGKLVSEPQLSLPVRPNSTISLELFTNEASRRFRARGGRRRGQSGLHAPPMNERGPAAVPRPSGMR